MSEVLVVASKIKKHIKDKSGMSTSATVMDALSRLLEEKIDGAIEKAKSNGRKTVMDKDFSE